MTDIINQFTTWFSDGWNQLTHGLGVVIDGISDVIKFIFSLPILIYNILETIPEPLKSIITILIPIFIAFFIASVVKKVK